MSEATHLKLADALPDAGYFVCQTYACALKKTACQQRQSVRGTWNGGTKTNAGVKKFRKVYIPANLAWCASGRCEQGKAIAAALPPVEMIQVKRRGCR